MSVNSHFFRGVHRANSHLLNRPGSRYRKITPSNKGESYSVSTFINFSSKIGGAAGAIGGFQACYSWQKSSHISADRVNMAGPFTGIFIGGIIGSLPVIGLPIVTIGSALIHSLEKK